MKNKKTIALAMAAATVAPMAVPTFAAERAIEVPTYRGVDVNTIDGRDVKYVEVVDIKEEMVSLTKKNLNPVIVGQDKSNQGKTIGYAVEFDAKSTVENVAMEKQKRDEIKKYLETIKDEKIDNTTKLRYTITEETAEYTFVYGNDGKRHIVPSVTTITVQDNVKTKVVKDGKEYEEYAKYVFTFTNVDTKFEISEDLIIEEPKFIFGAKDDTAEYKNLSKYIYNLKKAVKEDSLYVTTKLTNNDKTMIVKVYAKDKSTLLREITIDGYNKFESTLLTEIPVENDFTGHWAEDAIVELMLDSVIPVGNTVNPKNDMSRAQFVRLVCEALQIPAPKLDASFELKFKDVSKGDWYARYVVALNERGLINGYEDGTFRADSTITRQEASVVFAAIEKAKANKKDVTKLEKIDLVDLTTRDNDGKLVHKDIKTKFVDDAKIPAWCDEAVAYLATDEEGKGSSIISGYTDNTFRPANKIKNAEAMMMAYQARK